MRSFAIGVALVAAALAVLMGWQHLRFQGVRRAAAQDLQSPLYAGSTFHVVTFLALAPGQDEIAALRGLAAALESDGAAKLVYAGRVALVALHSSQLPETDWDAVLVVQHPSREAYDQAVGSSRVRDALAGFADTYSHGFERPVLLNLAIPQLLLALSGWRLVTFQPSHYPLVPASFEAPDGPPARLGELRSALLGLGELGRDAVVVANLLKHGSEAQQAADQAYGLAMAGPFAERTHGPLHVGRAVRVEGQAEFDRVAIVYYPGARYFADLIGSRFFQGIVGGKQPGDTLSTPTAPLLPLLRERPR